MENLREHSEARRGGVGEKMRLKLSERWFGLPKMPSVSHGKEQTRKKEKREKRKNEIVKDWNMVNHRATKVHQFIKRHTQDIFHLQRTYINLHKHTI